MKKFLFAVIMTGLVGTNLVSAQNSNNKQDKAIDNKIAFEEAAQAIENRDFILRADMLTSPYGVDPNVNPNECFILVNGDSAHFQTHPQGYVFEGKISDVQFKEDKKGNIKFSMRMTGNGNSSKIYLTMKNNSNAATASARLERMTMQSDLTFTGKVYPLEGQQYIKGFVKQSRGVFMNPFMNP